MGSKGTGLDVYWNLHKYVWSVKDRRQGVVVLHSPNLIAEDVGLIVQPAGRKRVLSTGKKNVHAFVRSASIILNDNINVPRDYIRIKYNPYKFETFVDEDESPIYSAKIIFMTNDGRCYAKP